MEKLLISSCLLGISSRYDGKRKAVFSESDIAALTEKYELVPFCPEIYGGLPTPRVPSEIIGDKVIMKDGTDVTENYNKGAAEALYLCKLLGIKKALLKERSPSCGVGKVYNGAFDGTLRDGNGVTAELLLGAGIELLRESDIDKLLK